MIHVKERVKLAQEMIVGANNLWTFETSSDLPESSTPSEFMPTCEQGGSRASGNWNANHAGRREH